ncbi:hypothetical protein ABFS82_13G011700 [Erythranthe guttata]|uniref:WD repeat-containing protein 26-like n=1 Tax=Erythranthe guttata TaxID=4155 RepID=UPI00064E07E3|nr:PREDICTED: WD repeat-containing protein 26-like [Erythranthe guttata]|eukprot:XP_012830916.1 PREDICTED: WD repeat-containing protein 26-like [Erythranthe guttata]
MDLPSTSSQGGGNEVVRSNTVIKRTKLVRGIKSLLYSFGYDRKGKSLEKGPGIELHKELVDLFIEQIIDGKCDESQSTLLDICKDADKKSLLILERKFYELLSDDKVIEACKTLGLEIAPLDNSDEITREHSTLIISPSENLCGQESGTRSRKRVLKNLGNLFLPKKSLKPNHPLVKGKVPYKTVQTLMSHGPGEVWFTQFSHCGRYLAATSGNDVNIWEFRESGEITRLNPLVGHVQPVSYITWRISNDFQLLTCGVEENVKRWKISPTGDVFCLHTYRKENLGTVSCVWDRNGESIFAGLNNGSIIKWNLEGEEVGLWDGTRTTMIADLAITLDGSELITTCEYDTILFFRWEDEAERFIYEDADIVSFSMSEDGRYLLVCLADERINLWDIRGENPWWVMTYEGYRCNRYVVRACFCGQFIASGSEDSMVHIWCTVTGRQISQFVGHSGTVNCVSWNPARPLMLASGGDDHIVQAWDFDPYDYLSALAREFDFWSLVQFNQRRNEEMDQ